MVAWWRKRQTDLQSLNRIAILRVMHEPALRTVWQNEAIVSEAGLLSVGNVGDLAFDLLMFELSRQVLPDHRLLVLQAGLVRGVKAGDPRVVLFHQPLHTILGRELGLA